MGVKGCEKNEKKKEKKKKAQLAQVKLGFEVLLSFLDLCHCFNYNE